MGKKFKIEDSDTLLLADGQIIKFDMYEYNLIYKNNEYYIDISDVVIGIINKIYFDGYRKRKPRRVVAKVNLKCELRKK